MPLPCDNPAHHAALPCTHPNDEGLCMGGTVWGRKPASRGIVPRAGLSDCPYLERCRQWWRRYGPQPKQQEQRP